MGVVPVEYGTFSQMFHLIMYFLSLLMEQTSSGIFLWWIVVLGFFDLWT